MRHLFPVIIAIVPAVAVGQARQVTGTYAGLLNRLEVRFNPDSTFEYKSWDHPVFYSWERFSEQGRWTVSGDTIILNPQLIKKPFVESALLEEEEKGEPNLLLNFNHIKRYYNAQGQVVNTDTVQITRLDYAFNELKKKKLTRVAPHRTVRCTFAGYIPKEVITKERTIVAPKPADSIIRIFIGCYEQQRTQSFVIYNPKANHFTFNVYSNYYQDGLIRQVKFLIRNDNVLYTHQKENGQFKKDNIWSGTSEKIKKQKTSS